MPDENAMRYDPTTRLMTLSFVRDPAEHAGILMEVGKRLVTSTKRISAWVPFFGAIAVGVVVGITMELYRHFVLPLMLHDAEIAPLSIVVLQLLPIILLLIALYIVAVVYVTRSRRKVLVSRFAPGVLMDVDIFEKGISTSSNHFTVEMDWLCVKEIIVTEHRIDLESENGALYFPERAFADRRAFNEAVATFRRLWREAKKTERDTALIRAGVD